MVSAGITQSEVGSIVDVFMYVLCVGVKDAVVLKLQCTPLICNV